MNKTDIIQLHFMKTRTNSFSQKKSTGSYIWFVRSYYNVLPNIKIIQSYIYENLNIYLLIHFLILKKKIVKLEKKNNISVLKI